MASGMVNFQEPILFIRNFAMMPVISKPKTVRIMTIFTMPITMYLLPLVEEYVKGKRNLQQDRLDIYNFIEDRINHLGMDGHYCLLRFICEIHRFDIAEQSFIGYIFSSIFTTETSQTKRFYPYAMAELLGRQRTVGACRPYYDPCPMSLFMSLALYDVDPELNPWNVDPEAFFGFDVGNNEISSYKPIRYSKFEYGDNNNLFSKTVYSHIHSSRIDNNIMMTNMNSTALTTNFGNSNIMTTSKNSTELTTNLRKRPTIVEGYSKVVFANA